MKEVLYLIFLLIFFGCKNIDSPTFEDLPIEVKKDSSNVYNLFVDNVLIETFSSDFYSLKKKGGGIFKDRIDIPTRLRGRNIVERYCMKCHYDDTLFREKTLIQTVNGINSWAKNL